MVAQETHQNPTIPLQKTEHFDKTEQFDQDPYEAEETLSLCDLPTHSDSAHWDDYRSSSNEEEDEDDFFEFFSEDFTAAAYPAGKDIIFCGKLISLGKESPIFAADKTNYQSQEIGNAKRPKKGIFRSWKSDSKISATVKKQKSMNTSLSFPQSKSYYKKCEMSKASILSGTPSKSKWFLFMFGMARFPTEMELRDIRMRQSRRSPATMFGAKCEESGQMGSKGKMGKSGSRGKGLWGLLRAFSLGCGSRHSHHANAVVKGGLPPTLD